MNTRRFVLSVATFAFLLGTAGYSVVDAHALRGKNIKITSYKKAAKKREKRSLVKKAYSFVRPVKYPGGGVIRPRVPVELEPLDRPIDGRGVVTDTESRSNTGRGLAVEVGSTVTLVTTPAPSGNRISTYLCGPLFVPVGENLNTAANRFCSSQGCFHAAMVNTVNQCSRPVLMGQTQISFVPWPTVRRTDSTTIGGLSEITGTYFDITCGVKFGCAN